jgi:hypothetical protein
MMQHQWRNKAPAAERYDVINHDRHIGKFEKRSEGGRGIEARYAALSDN